METSDRYLAIHNLALLQRQAGVEKTVAELVVAYGRLQVDNGEPLDFDPPSFQAGSDAEKRFLDLRSKNPEIDERFLAFLAAYSARMSGWGYSPIVSCENLADSLGYHVDHLQSVAARAERFYRAIRLPRKNGSFRQIHSPREPIRTIQRWILDNILSSYRPHEAAHGFVRGRSIVTNASRHTGNGVLIALDIADFFPSITHRDVRKGFEKLGYPYSVAVLLASLCTRSGRLPQGAPTSPALSNLVCESLDRRLSALAGSRGFIYSRYADDMAFSSQDPRLNQIIPFLRQIIEEEGFKVRDEKTRVSRQGARKTVTGIVVNERLNLPREHVRYLRAVAHRMATKGKDAVVLRSPQREGADPRNVLAGHLGFLGMINPERRSSVMRGPRRERVQNPDTV